MSDEFVCEECAYSTANDERVCPLCGGRVINIEEGLDDNFETNDQDDLVSPISDDFDFDADPVM